MKTMIAILSAVLLALSTAPAFAQRYSSGQQNQNRPERPAPPASSNTPKPIKYSTDVRNQNFNNYSGHRSDHGYQSNYYNNRNNHYQNRHNGRYNQGNRWNNDQRHRQNGPRRNGDRRR